MRCYNLILSILGTPAAFHLGGGPTVYEYFRFSAVRIDAEEACRLASGDKVGEVDRGAPRGNWQRLEFL
jgi:hypothetical protein